MVATLDIPVGPDLTEDQAEKIYKLGKDAVIFALLEMAKRLAEQTAAQGGSSHETPATPSGMKPPYKKPNASGRGKKKPGRKKGHPGARRSTPDHVDHRKDHRAKCCPKCGVKLNRCNDTRTRYTEDIPDIEPEVTEHTIHRDWCANCQLRVEPNVPDVLPGAMLGNRVLVLSAWLHYALGNTLSQIVDVFNFHMQLKLTPGGLVQMWYRLQGILYPWYQQIQKEALKSAVLHAAETGWRVNGKTHWLWSFSTTNLTYFMIDRSRGSPALMKFFIEEFSGTLVSDFWGAYNAVVCGVLGAFAARPGTCREVQISKQTLAGVCQETATLDRRRGSSVEAAGRTFYGGVCLAPAASGSSPAAIDRYRMERKAGSSAYQTPAPSPE